MSHLVGVEIGQLVVSGHVYGLMMQNVMTLRKSSSLDVLACKNFFKYFNEKTL
jgi:hypothetical protein